MVKKAASKEVAARTSKSGKAAEVRKAVLEARKNIENNYLVLASQLTEVHDREYYLDYGFKSFGEYAEVELETKYRKPKYFVDIWKRSRELKAPAAKLKAIGWTKAKEIIGVMNAENMDALFEMAKTKTTKELQDEVNVLKGGGSGAGGGSFMKLNLKLNEAEADVITTAIEEAKKAGSSENAVTALELICMEWMQEHQDAVPPSVESIIAYAKTVFGVTLTEGKSNKAARQAAEKKLAAAKIKAAAEKEAADKVAAEKKKKKTTAKKDPSRAGKRKSTVKKEEEEAAAKAAGETVPDYGKTKKAMGEYIKEHDLEVKIARSDTLDVIREKIKSAEAEEKGETETEPGSDDVESLIGDDNDPGEEGTEQAEEEEGSEDGEDNINSILGID